VPPTGSSDVCIAGSSASTSAIKKDGGKRRACRLQRSIVTALGVKLRVGGGGGLTWEGRISNIYGAVVLAFVGLLTFRLTGSGCTQEEFDEKENERTVKPIRDARSTIG
jgi:hypothetical protein